MKEIINKIKNRKKKKGFTLVELLAVIVILAIIMILTIPAVLNNVGEAKKKSFETVGKTLIKYIDDNYKNCKLGNKDIAKYDESLFDPNTCNLKNEIKEGTNTDWINNAGYNKEEIKDVEVSINSEGKVDITVEPSDTGEYKDADKFTTIVLNYDPSCWNYSGSTINGFNGFDAEGNILEKCNGFIEKDSEGLYHLGIPEKIGDTILTTIGDDSFNGSLISFVSIPESITDIGNRAFNGSKIKKVNFKGKSNLKDIGIQSFVGTQLEEITIPASVEYIGIMAFNSLTTLKKVTFEKDSNLIKIDMASFSQSGITSITIPKSVKEILNNAFYGCISLSELSFEENSQLESIEANAFYLISDSDIIIPKSVETIGNGAFYIENEIKIAYCGPNKNTNWYRNSSMTTIDRSNC